MYTHNAAIGTGRTVLVGERGNQPQMYTCIFYTCLYCAMDRGVVFNVQCTCIFACAVSYSHGRHMVKYLLKCHYQQNNNYTNLVDERLTHPYHIHVYTP